MNRTSVLDTLRILGQAVLPTLVGGVIKRRPRVMRIAQRLQLDRPSVPLFQQLRRRYGTGPLMLRIPLRSVAVVLSGADADRILQQSPEPFSPASPEKKAALSHFQPHGVLISTGGTRGWRREFNEAVLQAARPLHELAPRVVAVVHEEVDRMLDETGDRLDWASFAVAWWRTVRRVAHGTTPTSPICWHSYAWMRTGRTCAPAARACSDASTPPCNAISAARNPAVWQG